MKTALIVLACVFGYVYSESCTLRGDCMITTCGPDFEVHCIDTQCVCTERPGTPCRDQDDCRRQHNNHERCGAGGDLEWECVHHECHCRQ